MSEPSEAIQFTCNCLIALATGNFSLREIRFNHEIHVVHDFVLRIVVEVRKPLISLQGDQKQTDQNPCRVSSRLLLKLQKRS